MADAAEELLDEALHGAETRDEETKPDAAGDPADEDEVLISFDGEGDAPPQGEGQDSGTIRHLRDQLREAQRENRELKRQAPGVQKIEVGEKPKLADFDYNEERYEAELDAWKDRASKAKAQEQTEAQAEEARQAAWNKRLGDLEVQRTELGAKDYDQAAEEVRTTFSADQQALIVRATKNPARMIYALGKSPAKAAELAKITDLVDFIAEISRLEGKTTVTSQRRAAPAPEQVARGSGPLTNGPDRHEQRLEAEAAKTGNYTKLFDYRRQKRRKA